MDKYPHIKHTSGRVDKYPQCHQKGRCSILFSVEGNVSAHFKQYFMFVYLCVDKEISVKLVTVFSEGELANKVLPAYVHKMKDIQLLVII